MKLTLELYWKLVNYGIDDKQRAEMDAIINDMVNRYVVNSEDYIVFGDTYFEKINGKFKIISHPLVNIDRDWEENYHKTLSLYEHQRDHYKAQLQEIVKGGTGKAGFISLDESLIDHRTSFVSICTLPQLQLIEYYTLWKEYILLVDTIKGEFVKRFPGGFKIVCYRANERLYFVKDAKLITFKEIS